MDLARIFLSSFEKGGSLMWVIFFVSLVAWYIGASKLADLSRFSRQRKKFLLEVENSYNAKECKASTGNSNYDTLLTQIHACAAGSLCGPKGILREFLISTVPHLNKGFPSMSAWISIAPLLGLLGTITGMIQTFKVIMDFGIGNPGLTAEGISVALLTTQAGLTVAFPAMIFHNYLANRKNAMVNLLIKDCEQIMSRISPTIAEGKDNA